MGGGTLDSVHFHETLTTRASSFGSSSGSKYSRKKAMASQSLIVEPLVELERQGKGIGKRIPVIV